MRSSNGAVAFISAGSRRVGGSNIRNKVNMEKEKQLTSPWVYAGLEYRNKVLILNKHNNNEATLRNILDCCAMVFEVEISDIVGPSRKQRFTMPRHAFVLLARNRTAEPYTSIAKSLGGRDHATIVNSRKTAANLLQTYPAFRDKYRMCESLLKKIDSEKEEKILMETCKKLEFVKDGD